MKNYYELLEVDIKASKEIIDKAFKVLAKRYHPDTQPEEKKAWAEEIFKELNEAYEVLSNEEARKKYDIELDYDKNRAIQALCAKNKHLENLVESLQTELNELKNEQTSTINNFANYYTKRINDYQNYYSNLNSNDSHVNTPSDDTVYYNTNFSRIRNIAKSLITFIITIFFMIFIGFLLWKIPFTNSFLINIYAENAHIRAIVDFFLKLFQ